MQKLITIKTDKTLVASPLGELKFKVNFKENNVQVSSMKTQEEYGNLIGLIGITSVELFDYLKDHPEQVLVLEDPVEPTPVSEETGVENTEKKEEEEKKEEAEVKPNE